MNKHISSKVTLLLNSEIRLVLNGLIFLLNNSYNNCKGWIDCDMYMNENYESTKG